MEIAVILSGGSGARFGKALPKQYHTLCGREVIAYSVDAMQKSCEIDAVIVAADPEHVERLTQTYGVTSINSGPTRNGTIWNCLEYIKTKYPACEKILINEAARPFITAEIIDDYFRCLDDYDAVITAQHITDSLGREGEAITNRSEYYLIQAPEAFRFDYLYRHFKADSPITATVQQLPPDRRVKKNYDFKHNMKITYPEDLHIAEILMEQLRGKRT